MACFFGRARLPPSRDVTVRPRLCRRALLRGPLPAIPLSKPDPPASRAAQRELRPPIRCGHSPPPVRPFRGRVSGQTLSDTTSCLRVFVVLFSTTRHQGTKLGRARLPPSRNVTLRPQLCQLALLRGPIPAIPFSKPDPPAPRAAQRELRPPIRCGHSGGEFPDRL